MPSPGPRPKGIYPPQPFRQDRSFPEDPARMFGTRKGFCFFALMGNEGAGWSMNHQAHKDN